MKVRHFAGLIFAAAAVYALYGRDHAIAAGLLFIAAVVAS